MIRALRRHPVEVSSGGRTPFSKHNTSKASRVHPDFSGFETFCWIIFRMYHCSTHQLPYQSTLNNQDSKLSVKIVYCTKSQLVVIATTLESILPGKVIFRDYHHPVHQVFIDFPGFKTFCRNCLLREIAASNYLDHFGVDTSWKNYRQSVSPLGAAGIHLNFSKVENSWRNLEDFF